MSSRLNTLLIDTNGFGWTVAAKTTLWCGLMRKPVDHQPAPWVQKTPLKKLFTGMNTYAGLSYVNDWKEAFVAHPRLSCQHLDAQNLLAAQAVMKRVKDFDLIVLLHTALGDAVGVLNLLAPALGNRRGALLALVGNEYDLMPQKIAFLKKVQAQVVGTQLPLAAGRWLYQELAGAKIVSAPHGLNPAVYHPRPDIPRAVDAGFRGSFYPAWVGEDSRDALIRWFRDKGAEQGLSVDIGAGCLGREVYASHLCSFRAVVGGESGMRCLERDARAMTAAKAYARQNPQATGQDIYNRFYLNVQNAVDGRAVSSRHFEPMGTKTVQVLVEGFYNGLLLPGKHYIAVNPDFSNLDEAVLMLKDKTLCREMAEYAYADAMENHTYARRVESLVNALSP